MRPLTMMLIGLILLGALLAGGVALAIVASR
jgi:hypothetical protein